MAIDSADKRASVLGSGVIPLTVFPLPNAGISTDDRRQVSSFYRGILTATIPRFRWIAEQDSSSTYRCEQDQTTNFKCEQDSSLSFAHEIKSSED